MKAERFPGRVASALGFTLIELLIAVAVVAILAAIAIPSYSAYIVRGQRAAAKAVLLQTAQAMERYYTVNGSYLSGGAFPTLPGAASANCIALAPMNATTTTYCITGAIPAAGTAIFTLSATPCGDTPGVCPAGANNSFVDSGCDILTIDNTGAKSVQGSASLPSDQCWQR
jgi:type IV pilus assembly protein PilE